MLSPMATYTQYRAPRADNAALVDPPWDEQLARLGPERPEPPAIELGGVSLASLAAAARRELVAAAVDYTSAYGPLDSEPTAAIDAGAPLVVTGHQPELYHPGVWFKNFALASLAERSGGVGVHLLIDSDLCRAPSVATPTGSVGSPRVTTVAYDAPRAGVPYEQREIADRDRFRSFPGRLSEAVASLVDEPMVHVLWRRVDAVLGRTSNLGEALSELRHRQERAWGSPTLELPVSTVCDSESFRRLAAELLLRSEEVANAYNAALDAYRLAHKLRNAAQPLPDLASAGGESEAPLWVWSDDRPERRPLFVRRRDGTIELSDHAGWRAEGPGDADGVVAWLGELRSCGVKVRSRALVTTLYARLVLADLFLHGIGGAKYDQVTDRFAERLLRVAPPRHATLSATLRLPIDHTQPTAADRRELLRRRRELRYHPEKFTPDHPRADEKRRWVATEKTPANAAERHRAITAANEAMSADLTEQREAADRRLAEIERGLKSASVLDSREYSFCLYPAGDARRRLEALCRPGERD